MKYYKKIIGEKCYLSPINPEDAEQYCEWLSDLTISINLTIADQIISLPKEKEILDKMAKDGTVFSIVENENDKLIGNCGLHNIDKTNRNAEFGIFIGNKKFWNKGYGTEATKLILDYGFNLLNLENIMLRVYNFNERAIRSYEKAGFKKIGIRRNTKIFGHKKYDTLLMDIISEEFESNLVKDFFETNKK